MNRRQLLGLLLTLAAVLRGKLGYGALLGPRAASAVPAALETWLDTLIPADATASATQLGVHTEIAREYAANGGRPLLEQGCAWLDAEARKLGKAGFTVLSQPERDALAAIAAGARPGSAPREFFERTRYDALRLYYANPASWPALGYYGPPQPRGFTDHARAPMQPR